MSSPHPNALAPIPGRHPGGGSERAESTWSSVLDDVPDPIVRWRPDGTRTFVNLAYARMLGRPAADLVGTSVVKELADDDGAALLAQVRACSPAQPTSTGTARVLDAALGVRWYAWTHRAYFDASGVLVELQSVGHDVTTPMQVGAELRHANRAFRILSQANQAIARATDERGLFTDVCQAIVKQSGYRIAWVGIAEHDPARTVTIAARAGDAVPFLDPPVRWSDDVHGRGPTGTAIREGRPVCVRDTGTDPSVALWRKNAEALGIASVLSLPLRVRRTGADDDAPREVIGALTVYAPDPEAFGPAESELFLELAEDLAFGVHALRTRQEHRRAEQERAAHEQMLRTFIRHTPAAVAILDREMRYIEVSERWITDYQLDGRDLIGRCHYDVFPDLPQRFKEDHKRCLAGIPDRKDDDPFERADGTIVWLQWELHPWYDVAGAVGGIIMLTQVITEKIRARRALEEALGRLRASEAQLRQVTENLNEVVWLRDVRDRHFLYLSAAYARIWGRPTDVVLADPATWLAHVHPDDRALLTSGLEQGRAVEYRIRRADGSERWLRSQEFPALDEAGQPTRRVGVAEDITERREIEAQLRQRQRLEAVGQLAGGIAHDFNNLLLVMLMEIDLIESSGALAPTLESSVHEIRAAADRAAHMTRQLLQFSRRQVLRIEPVDLNAVVIELGSLLRRIVREDVKITLDLLPRPVPTLADVGLIEQVLMNLVVNARDAMPSGGLVRISTRLRSLAPGDRDLPADLAPGRYACLIVTDQGSGIPAEHLPRIFEPFFTTKEPGQGTGLGLATVFGIVQQHQGTVLVRSEPGLGSEFTVLLPERAEAATDAPPRERRTTRATGTTVTVPRADRGPAQTILVVEDELMVRRLTVRVLAHAGYQVLEATSGDDALVVWERHGGAIDLVLTDLVMPGAVNGRQLASTLRERSPSVRVVLTSGYSEELAGHALSLGHGVSYLAKPYRPDELLHAIRDVLLDTADATGARRA